MNVQYLNNMMVHKHVHIIQVNIYQIYVYRYYNVLLDIGIFIYLLFIIGRFEQCKKNRDLQIL